MISFLGSQQGVLYTSSTWSWVAALYGSFFIALWTISRIAYVPIYALGLQPWRTILFALANTSSLALGVYGLIAALVNFWPFS